MKKAHPNFEADVREFMKKHGQDMNERPCLASYDTSSLREHLILEESRELCDALEYDDLPGIADGIADLIYVTVGTAIAYGIPLTEVWNAVHAANMKKPLKKRADGKVMKNETWKHPDIEDILRRAGYTKVVAMRPASMEAWYRRWEEDDE
jgi:predicted HAD superfamily Cof-like phosphohydrolase